MAYIPSWRQSRICMAQSEQLGKKGKLLVVLEIYYFGNLDYQPYEHAVFHVVFKWEGRSFWALRLTSSLNHASCSWRRIIFLSEVSTIERMFYTGNEAVFTHSDIQVEEYHDRTGRKDGKEIYVQAYDNWLGGVRILSFLVGVRTIQHWLHCHAMTGLTCCLSQ